MAAKKESEKTTKNELSKKKEKKGISFSKNKMGKSRRKNNDTSISKNFKRTSHKQLPKKTTKKPSSVRQRTRKQINILKQEQKELLKDLKKPPLNVNKAISIGLKLELLEMVIIQLEIIRWN